MNILVIGGGAIGTLAGWAMPDATVLDWRKPASDADRHRPRRYGAMYLHEPLEGLPCREFMVRTTVDGAPATEASVRRYKEKIGKPFDMAGDWHLQFKGLAKGYEVIDFPKVDVQWGQTVERIHMQEQRLFIRGAAGPPPQWDALISTIPLYSLLELLDIQMPTPLRSAAVGVRTTATPLDVVAVSEEMHINYVSSPTIPVYRTTDRGGSRDNEWLHLQHRTVGAAHKILRPGKIYPAEWTEDMLFHLNRHNIYPVGRAATWRPDELTHDSFKTLLRLAQDVRS